MHLQDDLAGALTERDTALDQRDEPPDERDEAAPPALTRSSDRTAE